MVYFHALKDSCLEKHLYCVSVNRPGEVGNIDFYKTFFRLRLSYEVSQECLNLKDRPEREMKIERRTDRQSDSLGS